MVSVDTVYQRVLAIANKEQRGYITPQEFNLYANQAQIEIFDNYFNSVNYGEEYDFTEYKISQFEQGPVGIDFSGTNIESLNAYKIIQINFLSTAQYNEGFLGTAERITFKEYQETQNTPLTKATLQRPIYYIKNKEIYCYPFSANAKVQAIYIKKPDPVNWTYIVVNEKPLYNSSASDHRDFELHKSEEKMLVYKILQLAGVGIKDLNLAQLANQKEVFEIQKQQQNR
jgi:hypothetical protein